MQETSPSTVDPRQLQLMQQRLKLTNAFSGGAGWFYWIAALSLINSLIFLGGGRWSFFIALGATQLVDGITLGVAQEIGLGAALVFKIIAFVVDLFIAGVFAGCGYFAKRRQRWAYIVGMILYGFDAVIFLIFTDWGSLAFHAFALFMMFTGLLALNQLRALEQAPVGQS
jgi:hypothetical protein